MVLLCEGDRKYFSNELLRCMRERKEAEAKFMLRNLDLRNLIDSSQSTLFHYAAKYGNKYLITHLIGVGCNINAQDGLGKTPLILAVEENHEVTVDVLLLFKSDLYIIDNLGRSALQLAFDSKICRSLHIVDKLLYRMAQLHVNDNEEIAKRLIEANCPLYFAVRMKNVAVTKILIDYGLPVNAWDRATGETPLHVAAKLTDRRNVKLLLDHGAEVNAKDRVGKVPFINCSLFDDSNQSLEVLKMLLDRGMNLTSINYKGDMQFCKLSRVANNKFLELVLEYDIDFMARDLSGNTVLHYLAYQQSINLKQVKKKKFDVSVRNKEGLTALQLAFMYNNVDLIYFLLDNGAKVDNHNKDLLSDMISTRRKHVITGRNTIFIERFMQYEEGIQFVLKNQEKIFDCVLENSNKMLEFVLALLAMLHASGKEISKNTLKKIYANRSYTERYNLYQRQLVKMKKKILYESVTMFKLLTENESKITLYMRNQELVAKLSSMKCKFNPNSYYIDVLRKRVIKAIRVAGIKKTAVITLCKITGLSIDADYIIADKIISYLDEYDQKNFATFRR